jgi:hypothetical protein
MLLPCHAAGRPQRGAARPAAGCEQSGRGRRHFSPPPIQRAGSGRPRSLRLLPKLGGARAAAAARQSNNRKQQQQQHNKQQQQPPVVMGDGGTSSTTGSLRGAAPGQEVSRPRQAAAAGGTECTALVTGDRIFQRGVSIAALRKVAEGVGDRSTRQSWDDIWAIATVAPGWTVSQVLDKRTQWCWDYRRESTGAVVRKGPSGFKDAKEAAAHSPTPRRTAPEECVRGCKSVADLLLDEPIDGEYFGKPTHFVSFPWDMPFCDLVDALDAAVTSYKDGTPFLWMDVISLNYHQWVGHSITKFVFYDVQEAIDSIGRIVQACTKWSEPERLKRAWMMLESFTAVEKHAEMRIAITKEERSAMADKLRENGPNAVLEVVFHLEGDPAKAEAQSQSDLHLLTPVLEGCVDRVGGIEVMRTKLAELTRRAYAEAIDAEFEQRWEAAMDTPEPTVPEWSTYAEWSEWEEEENRAREENKVRSTSIMQSRLDVYDLGHHLACLWALTSNTSRAEEIFQRIIDRLDVSAANDGRQIFNVFGRVARVDKTSAEFVKMLNKLQRVEDAHKVEREASPTGQLAVSWKGVSISFLEKFVEEYRSELEFLSTDATVERIVKPRTKTTVMFDPQPKGVALIETVHDALKGTPNFFLTHAWRQTFYVPETCGWRGGIVQAIIDSVDACDRETTYFWFDIFTVNQHQTALAFAFEPLRNAIVECKHLKMFMETWDDPAPLSRVWCLDELKNALLLGVPVEICMPKQAQKNFVKSAKDSPETAKETIQRVCGRVDIRHASATHEKDRKSVLDQVEDTVGYKFLNEVCREIIKDSLLSAANLTFDDPDKASRWGKIFTERLQKADTLGETQIPQKIEIQRAVAMAQRRIFPRDQFPAEYQRGTQLLKEVSNLARRFYGEESQLFSDIVRQNSN